MINKEIKRRLYECEIKDYILWFRKEFGTQNKFWCDKIGCGSNVITFIINGKDGHEYRLSEKYRDAFTREIKKMIKKLA